MSPSSALWDRASEYTVNASFPLSRDSRPRRAVRIAAITSRSLWPFKMPNSRRASTPMDSLRTSRLAAINRCSAALLKGRRAAALAFGRCKPGPF